MKTNKLPNQLRYINTCLSFVVILLAFYIMFTPLLPHFGFWMKSISPNKPHLVDAAVNNQIPVESDIPDNNMLVIPRLVMQEEIHEGNSATALSKGVWRRPETSNPNQGSNTVLVGHRFTYSNPAVFYHLDKIKIGDVINVYWDKSSYTYVVSRVFVVPATAIEIESPSVEPILTLYTCTPIWTAKDRLVVQATLKEEL